MTKEIEISDDVKVILEVEGKEIIKEKVFEGLNIYDTDKRLSLYEVCIKLALNQISVKTKILESVEQYLSKNVKNLDFITGIESYVQFKI